MKRVEYSQPSQLRALWVLTKYSFLANVRNPATVFFGIAFPLIFIMVFGLLGEGSANYELGITKNSVKSGPIYAALKQVEVIELKADLTDAELTDQLKKGQIPAVLELKLADANQANNPFAYELKLQTSAADPQDAAALRSIIEGMVGQINKQAAEQEQVGQLEVEETKVSGRKFKQIDFVLPGQLSFALLSTGVFGLAFTFLALRKTLVIKRIFATPVKKWVLIMSEVFSRSLIALVQASIIILVGVVAFDFTLANGFWTFLMMLAMSSFSLLLSFGLGLIVSAVSDDENTIPAVANLITLPQFLLAGTFFPIETLPSWLQPVAKAMPMSFINEAMRKISFEGASLVDVTPQIGFILLWCLIIYAVVIKVFRWE